MKSHTLTVLSNVVLFQVGWFSCVWSAAAGRPSIGVVVIGGIVIFHLLRTPMPKKEFQLILLALGIGLLFDSFLVVQGLVKYSSGMIVADLAPSWIVALWGLFATILNVSLRWMRGRWMTAACFGALGGPAAYYGGLRLGALQFGNIQAGLTALAIGWAVLTPLLLVLSERFDGHAGRIETVPT